MTVEASTYINTLNASYPAATDPKSEGDDHIRAIKSAVKLTFPNVTGPVTATQAELNSVTDRVTGPASATANALVKFDGTTGKLVKVSGLVEDAAGNFGQGVTPSAWVDDKALQLPQGSVSSGYEFGISINAGAYRTASNTWRYSQSSASVSRYNQVNGSHQWFTAPSGTAGNPITFTQTMVHTAAGFLKSSNNGDYSGNGLGASAPYHQFSTNQTGGTGLAVSNSSIGAGVCVEAYANTQASGFFYQGVGGGTVSYRVLTSGNVQNTNNSYGAISDLKLKDNIVDVSPKLAKLLQVRIVNYSLKADPKKTKLMGVIAQELEQISPGLIEETPDYEEVTRTREVQKTVPVTEKAPVLREQKTVEVVDGKAIVKTEWFEELVDVPVVDHYPLFDADNQPVFEVATPEVPEVRDADGNVTQPAVPASYRQALHSVPRMQEVTETETYTERVATGTTTKSVKYSVFVPMLIKAMQEQQVQIDALSGRLLALGAA